MKAGIAGLPYTGKSTLFCALTGQDYAKLSHDKDIHVGSVNVPDMRLDRLFEIFAPKKKTYATMEFFDIAGQSAGDKKVMEPQVLQTLKNADSLIVVLDGFSGTADPKTDFTTLMEDFALNDLLIVAGRLERIEKESRGGKSSHLATEEVVLETCREVLEGNGKLLEIDFHSEQEKLIRGYQFLTLKPLVIVVNISEDDLVSGAEREIEEQFSTVRNARCAAVSAEIEMEIASLDEQDRGEFLASMGIAEPALQRVIHLSYESLGLFSFFTVGVPNEVRAWTVQKGAKAPKCAGVIHSDMERGFIRAETIAFDDLDRAGSMKVAREHGLVRIEGKDYEVKDGDILTIRFSV